jgi:elongation factor G
MKEYQTNDIRNIALIGHGASGKTMICESMLACSGLLTRLGRVSEGNTVSDYHEDEQKQQHSIYASLLHAEWNGKKINIIDTPGYADFVGETLAALRVADMVVAVIHAEHGVELGTEQAWEYASYYKRPKMIIVNAVDRDNVNIDSLLHRIKEYFGHNIMPMMWPIATGASCQKFLDIVHKKVITYKDDGTGVYTTADVPEDFSVVVEALHASLAECVAESDDTLLDTFFAEGCLSEDDMLSGMHKAFKKGLLVPLFVTVGESNIGVRHVMDFIAHYGPSPADFPEIHAKNDNGEDIVVSVNDKEPSFFIFKTVTESRSGGLSLFRVYSGTVSPGLNMYNSSRSNGERVGQMFTLNGKQRDQIGVMHAGDIGAVAKLKDAHTNNTLCDERRIVVLPPVHYPTSNMRLGICAKNKNDEEKLSTGLATLHEEDPTFSFRIDSELHQTLIEGQGELHLETCVQALKKRFGVDIETFAPRIAYRETIKSQGDAKYRHKKQSGGAGQFAEVWMRIEPKSHDDEVEFTQSLVGQNVDRVFVPSVEKGVRAASEKGALAGYRVVGVKANFYDGKQHPVDSKDIAFQIAGKFAFREAFLQSKPCLLEPIMEIAVKVPDEYTGDIMSDISSRRGKILGIESDGRFTIVKAHVPQADLYRYSTTLRSIVGGRGAHTEKFSHYEEVPRELEKKIIEQHKHELDEMQ